MKKYILSIFCFLFFAISIHAQNTEIDSLKNELSIYTAEDTTRVNTLHELAYAYFRIDMDKTIECLKESKAIAEAINYKKGKGEAIYIRGLAEAVQSKYEKGFEYFEEALQLYKEANFKIGMDKCYNSMGIYFFRKGNQKQAIEYYLKSVGIKEGMGNKKGMATRLKYIGIAYDELGNYNEAIIYFKKALKISEEENNTKDISGCLKNLGNVYSSQGNYPLALEYYNKALSIEEKEGNTIGISKSLNNIGIIYENLRNYDKAIASYEKALQIPKEKGYERTTGSLLNNLGTLHKNKKNYKLAHKYLNEALKIYEEINNKTRIAVCLNNIGDLHLALKENTLAYQYFKKSEKINLELENQPGLCNSYLGLGEMYLNQKKYDKALVYLLKSKKISNELGMLDKQRDVSELLSETYKALGKYKQAFSSHQQFKILNDSIFNKENIEKITQLEYEYKYKQELESASNRELKLTETVNTTAQDLERSQRNLLLGVIAFLLMTLILGTIIFFLKLRNAKSNTQNIEIEQKLLRSQMTPHFIFNSLSVLQGMVLNKEDKKAILYLSKFSKLLRITLENSRTKMVPLRQELTAINNYLELQNLEVNQSYQYTVSVDDSIDKSLFEIPPMLIQPFIENAIEHGFKNQKENRKIDVQIKYLNKELICTIIDNGIGIDAQKENKKENKKSLATTITSERLKTLSKDFKIKGSIHIVDRQKYNEQGTIVTLVIPYKIIVA